MAKPAIKLIPPEDRTAHENVTVPVYVPTGIFTPNHPDFGKPNLMQAEFCLDRMEGEQQKIAGILRAISELLPNNEVLESLVWAAYKLHQDRTGMENLRHALCLSKAEGAK